MDLARIWKVCVAHPAIALKGDTCLCSRRRKGRTVHSDEMYPPDLLKVPGRGIMTKSSLRRLHSPYSNR